MKRICVAVVALLAGGALTGCMAYSPGPYETASAPPPGYDNSYVEGSPRVEVGFFYDDLSPYGNWVTTSQYGWVWYPRSPAVGWRPYTNGRWVDTAYGWTWVSFEPYGWATYHYGRWAQDPRYGWVWVPGTIWGPAWVSWQYGGGYVGWAPLPPSVGFEVGVGLRLGGLSLATRIRPDAYCFVPEHSFLQPRISGYLLPHARNVTIIHNTTNITYYGWHDNRVVNRGVDLKRIEHATKRRVQRYNIREETRRGRSVVSGRDVRVYRPGRDKLDTVRRRPHGGAPPPGHQAQPPVAPGVQRTQPAPRQIDKRDRHEQEQLRRQQDQERQRLERQRQQEQERARAKAERDRAEQRQREERARQQEEQRRQQDRARQQEEQRRQQERARQQEEQRNRQERARQQQEQRRRQEQAQPRQGTTRRAVPVRPANRTTPGARGKPAPRTTPTPTPKAKKKKKGKERPRSQPQRK